MSRLGERVLVSVAPFLGSILMRALYATIRFTYVDAPTLDKGENAIFPFWHGRMLMMPFAKKRFGRFCVMVSRHRDGELISRTMGWFGIATSRGSTTRGGASGLKDIIGLANGGWNISFTPDGPRGPQYTVQMGVIQAAKATGLKIYPVTYSTHKKKLLVLGTVL
jgi:lysophospholipid acyltransferase (LPLAT)-like uncharacterized protein